MVAKYTFYSVPTSGKLKGPNFHLTFETFVQMSYMHAFWSVEKSIINYVVCKLLSKFYYQK